VEVSYRRPGEAAWSPALPLLRLQRERVFVGPQFDVVAPNRVLPTVTDGFTGSAPDLGALEVGGAAPQYGPRR